MNVTEKAGKNSDPGQIKFLQDLLYTVVLYKTLIEKYFCSVQQSLKFEPKNK